MMVVKIWRPRWRRGQQSIMSRTEKRVRLDNKTPRGLLGTCHCSYGIYLVLFDLLVLTRHLVSLWMIISLVGHGPSSQDRCRPFMPWKSACHNGAGWRRAFLSDIPEANGTIDINYRLRASHHNQLITKQHVQHKIQEQGDLYSCMFTCIQLKQSLCAWTRDSIFKPQGCHAAWLVQGDSREYDSGMRVALETS